MTTPTAETLARRLRKAAEDLSLNVGITAEVSVRTYAGRQHTATPRYEIWIDEPVNVNNSGSFTIRGNHPEALMIAAMSHLEFVSKMMEVAHDGTD